MMVMVALAFSFDAAVASLNFHLQLSTDPGSVTRAEIPDIHRAVKGSFYCVRRDRTVRSLHLELLVRLQGDANE